MRVKHILLNTGWQGGVTIGIAIADALHAHYVDGLSPLQLVARAKVSRAQFPRHASPRGPPETLRDPLPVAGPVGGPAPRQWAAQSAAPAQPACWTVPATGARRHRPRRLRSSAAPESHASASPSSRRSRGHLGTRVGGAGGPLRSPHVRRSLGAARVPPIAPDRPAGGRARQPESPAAASG